MKSFHSWIDLGLAVLFLTACNLPAAAHFTPTPTNANLSPTLIQTDISIRATPILPVITPTSALPKHRIGLRSTGDRVEFYDHLDGGQFIPRGYNYVRVGILQPPCLDTGITYHTTFNVGEYDAGRVDQDLSQMQQSGYNVVRVFLSPACMVNANLSLSQEYLANLADFLGRASAHQIFTILTIDDFYHLAEGLPWQQDIQSPNSRYLMAEDIPLEGQRWEQLVDALVRLHAPVEDIFAYELQNEVSFMKDVPPLSLSSGILLTGNGKQYDLSNSQSRQSMMDENLAHWIDGVRREILRVDPTALVSVGFPLLGTKDNRTVRFSSILTDSTADLVDIHPYPGFGSSLAQLVEYFQIVGNPNKPLLMGEFGAPTLTYPDAAQAAQAVEDWQIASCRYGFDGWLFWTYNTIEDSNFWTASDQNGTINRWLAPTMRPDPCSPGTTITLNTQGDQVSGQIKDIHEHGISQAMITYQVKPLDGPGVFGNYVLSGVVPVLANRADVGVRINTECNCQGESNFYLYSGRYFQGSDPANRVPNPRFSSGMEGWGAWGDGVAKLVPNDLRPSHRLHITVGRDQTFGMNSSDFPVTSGEVFTATFEAQVSPSSVGSGYIDIVFLNGSQEVRRFTLPLTSSAFVSGEVTANQDGTFQIPLNKLPAGAWLVQVGFSGDDQNLPGQAEIKVDYAK
jgi:hypothetical protein